MNPFFTIFLFGRALDLAEFYEKHLREPYNNDIQQQLDAMTDQRDKDALLKEKPLLFPLSKKQAWWHEISVRIEKIREEEHALILFNTAPQGPRDEAAHCHGDDRVRQGRCHGEDVDRGRGDGGGVHQSGDDGTL